MINFLSQMPVGLINSLQYPFSNIFIFCATVFGTITILIALFYIGFHHTVSKGSKHIALAFRERAEEFFVLGISGFTAYFMSVFAKNYFAVLRPFVANPNLHNLINETGYSFPSGHATVFMAIATALYFMHKKAGVIFGVGALIIGISRIMVGVHTPFDILSGYILGFLISYIIFKLFRVRNKRNQIV